MEVEPRTNELKVNTDNAATPDDSSTQKKCAEKDDKDGNKPRSRVFKKIKLDLDQDKKNSEPLSVRFDEEKSGDLPESSSVTTSAINAVLNETEVKSPQIRSSARVFKKMKLEANAPQVTQPIIPDKKDKKEEAKHEIKKTFKLFWNLEERIMFFEAVNEYGKDFENIQTYIKHKMKKKGAPDEHIKSKDQVRQFFSRTFHEISKHVKFSDKIKRVVQELYGIINYGELYKKLGGVSEKSCMKLNELIYRGSIMLRSKGKTIRVKTPMCRALRKLNELDENYEDLRLPNRVTVELRPKDLTSYLRVQSMAQNPRLRTVLPLQKRLSSLLVCMSKRWKTIDAVSYEKAIVSSSPVTDSLVPSQNESNENMAALTPSLRLSPPFDAKVELPSINLSEYLTRQTICLTAYERRLGLDTFSDLKLFTKKKNPKQKADVEHKTDTFVYREPVKIEENEANSCNEAEVDSLADVMGDAVNTILSLQQKLERQDSEQSEAEDIKKKKEVVVTLNKEAMERIQKIKEGWIESDSGSLTIGEIYLMFGSDSKLTLEYSWDIKPNETDSAKSAVQAHFLERWSEFYDENYEGNHSNLSGPLSKLLSLAKLHYRTNRIKCPCGHVCSTKQKQNIIPDISFDNEQKRDFHRTPLFIQPKVSQGYHAPTMQQQLTSIQKLKPKYCNRKGRRPRTKQVVVERKLPLLPNNVESGHQIVRMNIISQQPAPKELELDENVQIELQNVISSPDDENSVISTVPSSPSRLLKENESAWINSEVADYSLSSLLGHLESPMKTDGGSSGSMTNDLSSEVDAHLHSLLTQSSVDFAANFADLAAKVNCEDNVLDVKKEN